jgi:hypothetical protein
MQKDNLNESEKSLGGLTIIWAYLSIVNVIWLLSGLVMMITFFPMVLELFGDILLKIKDPI